MKPTVCDVCAKPGVSPWTIRHAGRTVRRHLCVVHADPVRLLFAMAPDSAHRYGNPGDQPLTRNWVTPRDDVGTMDWMPLPQV